MWRRRSPIFRWWRRLTSAPFLVRASANSLGASVRFGRHFRPEPVSTLGSTDIATPCVASGQRRAYAPAVRAGGGMHHQWI